MGKLSKIRRGQIKCIVEMEAPKGLDEAIKRNGGEYHSDDLLCTDLVVESPAKWHIMDHLRLSQGSTAYTKARGLAQIIFGKSRGRPTPVNPETEFFAYHATGVSKREYQIVDFLEKAVLWLFSKNYRDVSYLHRRNPSLTRNVMLDEIRNMKIY